ncbi:arginase family protein [Labilibacter marinus]|uniref:arginase family protein n=1 Tax=Labilibacter marinus TaxID=1477105 RepID=UPI00082E0900|nr:arginase family protein [Labilibacter marinus]
MPEEDTLKSQIVNGVGEEDYSEDYVSNFDIAIIGISDSKNALGNLGCEGAARIIRENLASLRKITKTIKIIDLGDIRGNSLNDRYFALAEVSKTLLKLNVTSLLIGGAQDYVLPIAKAFTKEKEDVSIALIDSKLDFSVGGTDFSSQTFLSQVEQDCGERIFEVNVLGGQKYLIGESQENHLYNLNWHCTRLKDLRNENINSAEPIMRDANVISFDVGAIQQNNMPYFTNSNVNGFTGYEACQLGWYAGVSNKIEAFAVQEYNPEVDDSGKGGMLCAQIIWHFFDGMSQGIRQVESELINKCKISVVYLQDFGVDIRFYTNREDNRCWVEVPWSDQIKIIACDQKDLLQAQNGDLPDKWWRFFQLDSNNKNQSKK